MRAGLASSLLVPMTTSLHEVKNTVTTNALSGGYRILTLALTARLSVISSHAVERGGFACMNIQATFHKEAESDFFTTMFENFNQCTWFSNTLLP